MIDWPLKLETVCRRRKMKGIRGGKGLGLLGNILIANQGTLWFSERFPDLVWIGHFVKEVLLHILLVLLLPPLILDLLWAHQRPDKGQPQTLFIENPHNPILSSPYRKSQFMILKPSAQMFWFRDSFQEKNAFFGFYSNEGTFSRGAILVIKRSPFLPKWQ